MTSETPIGIDLGTTNSAVARVDGSGRTAMIPNTEGDLLTPSVVLFDETEVVVGKDARSATTVVPERVAEWVKRDMGEPVYGRPIRGEYLPPEVIQACILRKLKADVLQSLGHESRAVITVPAYFDEPRRQATVDAGEMAGLGVLDIVNEPTAAALAFGEALGYLSGASTPREKMTVLVYDLGGGTFDVTLLTLAPGDIRTLATDGDVQLGGHDWDKRLVDHLAESFMQAEKGTRFNLPERPRGCFAQIKPVPFFGRSVDQRSVDQRSADPRDDPASLGRLYNAVIEAKHTLSARNHASIRVDHAGHSLEVRITRRQFEEMTAALLERTAYTVRQLVAEAGLQWTNIARILLVGGSSRMPMVAQMLQQLTGIVPDRTVNPDEAVARGAALYASYLLKKQMQGDPGPSFEVTNVNAHGLGVEGIDQETMRKLNFVLIPRNTPLPARFTEKFITKSAGQQSIVVQVLQGESTMPGECTAIGRTVIRGLPIGLPKGWPVEVTFEYGANGRLNVRAMVPGTHREVTLELERDERLSGEGIGRWTQAVSSSAGFDTFRSAVQQQGGQRGVGTQDTAATGYQGGPPPIPSAQAVPPETANAPAQSASSRRIPRWAVLAIGYVSSAVIGLLAGYLVLHFLRPESFQLPW